MQGTVEEIVNRQGGRCNFSIVIMTTREFLDGTEKLTKNWRFPVILISDDEKIEAFASASASLACSGTIVTEALLFSVPTVVIYNYANPLTLWYLNRNARVEFVTLCNIMAGKMIVPEFLFEKSKQFKEISRQLEIMMFDNSKETIEQTRPFLSQLVRWEGDQPIRPSSMMHNLLNSIS